MTNVPDNPYLHSSFEHPTKQNRHAATDKIRLLNHDRGEYRAQELRGGGGGQSSVN
jgi:hypothetical protein